MNRLLRAIPVLAFTLATSPSWAQGLYNPVPEAQQTGVVAAQPLELSEVSTVYIDPPEPTIIQKHDLITIIIDENISASSSQSLDTKKEYDTGASVSSIVDPWALLELQLRQGNLANTDLIDAKADREFKGDGDYDRTDRFSARITATVLDVKPNGTLVLEARKHVAKDDEIQTLVLAGVCRDQDVTNSNTVLSSQLANLTIVLENEGEIREAAKKGLLSQILDTVFAF